MNYFEILNVSENAEDEVIRASYKALAKKYHPDNTELDADVAAQKMQEINEAYQVLADKNQRERYINELHKFTSQPEIREKKEAENINRSQKYENMQSKSVGFDSDDLFRIIVYGVVIISIICCLAYYGPGLLKDTCSSIWDSIQDVISTF
ncbi:MAG: J domain-containing protein [Pseudobutyrivibrio sp.]|nr:J domain-containing protein [Pseudobutyrivibrio sp.]